VKSSIGIVLFFLLGGFFLSALLGALERSRKMLGIAGLCLVLVVCVIVFLTPVQLPSWRLPLGLGSSDEPVTTTVVTYAPAVTQGAVHPPPTVVAKPSAADPIAVTGLSATIGFDAATVPVVIVKPTSVTEAASVRS
jgi:hypothetical protein